MGTKGQLTEKQANSLKGCGAGTCTQCFALHEDENDSVCLMVFDEQQAIVQGILQGWQVNPSDKEGIAYCPLGVLNHSVVDPDTQ
jgi:hypothetical protein